MAVQFIDNSIEVKAALDDEAKAWLLEWSNEIASTARETCAMDGDEGVQLRKSYRAEVDLGAGEAKVGTDKESGYWEENGTGDHAVNGDGRKGWWVYKDGYKGDGGDVLTEQEAKAIAARDPSLHATNGRPAHYTLEKAFIVNKPKAIADAETRLKRL